MLKSRNSKPSTKISGAFCRLVLPLSASPGSLADGPSTSQSMPRPALSWIELPRTALRLAPSEPRTPALPLKAMVFFSIRLPRAPRSWIPFCALAKDASFGSSGSWLQSSRLSFRLSPRPEVKFSPRRPEADQKITVSKIERIFAPGDAVVSLRVKLGATAIGTKAHSLS